MDPTTQTYNESIQEAYSELATQRKRGGTASKGIDKDITEHCGDPTGTDSNPMRLLLMKLYKKEMQCEFPREHFEVVKMIDGCRKNIGLDEDISENVFKKFAQTVTKPAQAVTDKVQQDFKRRKQLLGKGKTEA